MINERTHIKNQTCWQKCMKMCFIMLLNMEKYQGKKKHHRILDNFKLSPNFVINIKVRESFEILKFTTLIILQSLKFSFKSFCPKTISLDNQEKALPLLPQLCNALSVCRLTNALKRTLNLFYFSWSSRKVQKVHD